jgi:hypothetical protein
VTFKAGSKLGEGFLAEIVAVHFDATFNKKTLEKNYIAKFAPGGTRGAYLKEVCVVKLGYNDHGYNKFTLILNKIMSHFWSQMTGYKDIFHGYNESRL